MRSSTTKLRTQAVTVLTGLAVIGTFTACGSSSKSSDAGGDGSSDAAAAGVKYAKAEIAKYKPLATKFSAPGPALDSAKIKAKLQGKTVWYVPTFLQAPIFTANSIGLQAPLALAGAKVRVCDAKANPTQGASCIKQATAAKAAAIITDAMDYSFAPQAQAAAVKAGIPVISTDNDNDGDFPKDPLYDQVGFGVPKTWRLMADWIIADSGGKANLVWAADNSNAGKIHAGAMAEELKRYCPDCTATRVEFGDLTVQRLATSMSTALVKNPKATYVAGSYDAPSGIFALQGVKQVTGRKIKYITATGQPPGVQRVAAGQQVATPGADTVHAMWNTADAVFRAVTAEKPVDYPPALRVFEKDNVPKTISPQAYASGEWYTDGSFKPIYQKMWGL